MDEITELAVKYGIMTPYTSFLIREDVNVFDREVALQRGTGGLRNGRSAGDDRSADGGSRKGGRRPSCGGVASSNIHSP